MHGFLLASPSLAGGLKPESTRTRTRSSTRAGIPSRLPSTRPWLSGVVLVALAFCALVCGDRLAAHLPSPPARRISHIRTPHYYGPCASAEFSAPPPSPRRLGRLIDARGVPFHRGHLRPPSRRTRFPNCISHTASRTAACVRARTAAPLQPQARSTRARRPPQLGGGGYLSTQHSPIVAARRRKFLAFRISYPAAAGSARKRTALPPVAKHSPFLRGPSIPSRPQIISPSYPLE